MDVKLEVFRKSQCYRCQHVGNLILTDTHVYCCALKDTANYHEVNLNGCPRYERQFTWEENKAWLDKWISENPIKVLDIKEIGRNLKPRIKTEIEMEEVE